jgi:hypothetical protein
LVAVSVTWYVPAVPADGVPEIVAVPSLCAWKAIPGGRVPEWLNIGVGEPVAVTVKLAERPATKETLETLVMAAATPGA